MYGNVVQRYHLTLFPFGSRYYLGLFNIMCACEFVCICMHACMYGVCVHVCVCMHAYVVHVYGYGVLQLCLSYCLSLLMLAIEYLSRPI